MRCNADGRLQPEITLPKIQREMTVCNYFLFSVLFVECGRLIFILRMTCINTLDVPTGPAATTLKRESDVGDHNEHINEEGGREGGGVLGGKLTQNNYC